MKLCRLKVELKRWNTEVFGCVENQLKKAENELYESDFLAESRLLESQELARRRELRNLVWSLRKKKDSI